MDGHYPNIFRFLGAGMHVIETSELETNQNKKTDDSSVAGVGDDGGFDVDDVDVDVVVDASVLVPNVI